MNEFIKNMVFNTPVLVDGSLCEYKLFKDGFLHFYNIDQNIMVKVLLSDEERLERIPLEDSFLREYGFVSLEKHGQVWYRKNDNGVEFTIAPYEDGFFITLNNCIVVRYADELAIALRTEQISALNKSAIDPIAAITRFVVERQANKATANNI